MPAKSHLDDLLRLETIRRTAIVAMFSDDVLYQKLTLKGGNALSLIHGIGARTSVDVDLSLEDDFQDLDDIETRLYRSLDSRFEAKGFVVFKKTFGPRPRKGSKDPRWGGYLLTFKVISREKAQALNWDPEQLNRQAELTGYRQKRTFKIDFSKYEFCRGKLETEFDDYTIFVYTPEMIAVEKIRALCQQLDEYPQQKRPKPRPSDLYDIYSILTGCRVDLGEPENQQLVRDIFAAKDVPLPLISRIRDSRKFHRAGWDDVQLAVSEELKDYDFYFDFVLSAIEPLEALWVV